MDADHSIESGLRSGAEETRVAALAELLKPEADPAPHLAAVDACLDHPSETVRHLASVVLGRVGAPAVGSLVRALSPAQPIPVRTAAALGLAGVGPDAAPAVRELCRSLTSSNETLRTTASVALSKIGAPAASSLRLMLRFTDQAVVAAAVSALGFIGPPAAEVIPDLDVLAAGAPLPLQLACAAALVSASGDPARGLPVLLRALGYADPEIRKQTLERIAELGEAGHSALPHVLACVDDPSADVRAAAALTLGRVRAPADRAVAPLAMLLEDSAPAVRLNAAIALSGFGREAVAALPKLRARAQDPDASVAAAARAAIETIEK
jgi:HEAT repeat protein